MSIAYIKAVWYNYALLGIKHYFLAKNLYELR